MREAIRATSRCDFVHGSFPAVFRPVFKFLDFCLPMVVVVVVADFDIFEHAQGIVGQHGKEK